MAGEHNYSGSFTSVRPPAYYPSMAVVPTAAEYGVGPAWIGGILYWSDGSKWIIQGPVARFTSASNGPNLGTIDAVTSVSSEIDTAAFGVVALGGSVGGQCNNGMNAVGKSFAENIDLSNPADTYVAGTADYSQVFGYDNIANGLLSMVIGAHNLAYTAADHAFIVGARNRIENGSRNNIIGSTSKISGSGSVNCIFGTFTGAIDTLLNNNTIVGGSAQTIDNDAASGCAILGGSTNTITAGGVYNSIIGSAQSTISGAAQDYSLVLGGYLNQTAGGDYSLIVHGSGNNISSTGSGNAILASHVSTISGTANYGITVGGYNNTVSGLHAACINGSVNTASGAYSYTIGNNCTASGQSSYALGFGTKSDAHGLLAFAGRYNVAAGDAQTDIINLSTQTTDATDQITKSVGANGANVAAGAYCGEAYVVARKSDGSATSGFIVPFMFEKSGSTITVRKGQTRTDTTILYDGLGITSANAPYITGASGYFTVTVKGVAATTVNWSCSVRMARVI